MIGPNSLAQAGQHYSIFGLTLAWKVELTFWFNIKNRTLFQSNLAMDRIHESRLKSGLNLSPDSKRPPTHS